MTGLEAPDRLWERALAKILDNGLGEVHVGEFADVIPGPLGMDKRLTGRIWFSTFEFCRDHDYHDVLKYRGFGEKSRKRLLDVALGVEKAIERHADWCGHTTTLTPISVLRYLHGLPSREPETARGCLDEALDTVAGPGGRILRARYVRDGSQPRALSELAVEWNSTAQRLYAEERKARRSLRGTLGQALLNKAAGLMRDGIFDALAKGKETIPRRYSQKQDTSIPADHQLIIALTAGSDWAFLDQWHMWTEKEWVRAPGISA